MSVNTSNQVSLLPQRLKRYTSYLRIYDPRKCYCMSFLILSAGTLEKVSTHYFTHGRPKQLPCASIYQRQIINENNCTSPKTLLQALFRCFEGHFDVSKQRAWTYERYIKARLKESWSLLHAFMSFVLMHRSVLFVFIQTTPPNKSPVWINFTD